MVNNNILLPPIRCGFDANESLPIAHLAKAGDAIATEIAISHWDNLEMNKSLKNIKNKDEFI
jgi:hypothetical protein